jgi:hypothetical protein
MDKLNPVEVRMRDRRSRLRRARIDFDYNDWFEYRTNVDYVMTDKGTLVDPNKPVQPTTSSKSQTGDYRYQDAQPSTTNSLEEQRRKVQEEQQKLKDMEEEKNKKKKDSISGNSKKESLDDKDDNEDVAGSPIFSLVQIFN